MVHPSMVVHERLDWHKIDAGEPVKPVAHETARDAPKVVSPLATTYPVDAAGAPQSLA